MANRAKVVPMIFVAILATLTVVGWGAARAANQPEVVGAHVASITIDYPLDGSIFPPEITPPTFIWRDGTENSTRWRIDIVFGDGSRGIHAQSAGGRLAIGEIDPRCVSATNELPKLTPEQAVAHTWIPPAEVWEAIKKHSVAGAAVVTISGFSEKDANHAVSRGNVTFHTSNDPVGAPVFYRDVPLMPSETEKGIIKPLAPAAFKLIEWRLRDLSKPQSHVVLKDMVTCANCHSFSRDGRTMGMDMDGPGNDKGLYAVVPVKPQMIITAKDMVTWDPSHDRQFGLNRVGFMSQVSPDGKYVVTTVNPADRPPQRNFYVVNFKDYRFLQVFYPTRGVLAWYNRETGQRGPLPGADDPRYVQTDGFWSPDGSYIVFARAEARESYPPDGKMAAFANDPEEVQIQYDLYRVPFNGGKGGQAEAIAGASANGMSNTFPKVSPDGRWIVFVQCRNGQLMRPDSQLYIVPSQGGKARRMRCNTRLMNSWHSFSPNGRWLVFSSKARSPYTQMYLTHIDEQGNDSPAILIDNSTAANRAVNLPEFVNIPENGIVSIATPAVDMYRKFDHAEELVDKGLHDQAIAAWQELVAANPDDARIHNNLAAALVVKGRYAEAIPEYEEALELNPQYHSIHDTLGSALLAAGRPDEAIVSFEQGLEYYPQSAELHNHLGLALAGKGRTDEARGQFIRALEINPNYADAHTNLGAMLGNIGQYAEAIAEYRKALALKPDYALGHADLGAALGNLGQYDGAIAEYRKALALQPDYALAHKELGMALAHLGQYDGAIAEYRKALALNLDDAGLHTSLGVALRHKGQYDEAIAEYRKALALRPDDAPTHTNLGIALHSQGQNTEAVAEYRKALALQPDDASALNALGYTLAETGRYKEAIPYLEKALLLRPDDPNILDSLGVALAGDGQYAVAAGKYQRALQLDATRALLHLHLAQSLAKLGRAREAKIEFDRAYQLNPHLKPL